MMPPDRPRLACTAHPLTYDCDHHQVRAGTAVDPQHKGKFGTEVLRRNVRKQTVHLTFSLITADRTLDIEAMNEEEFDTLLQGFEAMLAKTQAAASQAAQTEAKTEEPSAVAAASGVGRE
jgi:hypothetical protein